jgi:glycosyltransferase involved in cell wall biosynthesis
MTSKTHPAALGQPIWEWFDSVYFFMWPGWRDQLESNRWHWGKRWAQRLPVVFIQPELATGLKWLAQPEDRLDNVVLLSIESASSDLSRLLLVGLRQAGQLMEYMRAQGHRRSLFWLYNSFLAPAYLVLPGSARIFHGTENYFDFDSLGNDALNLNRFAIEASDVVICCSNGVARGFAAHSRCIDPMVIPNGCEYAKYSAPTEPIGEWPQQIADWRDAGRKLAVFAGNINLRLDYELMIQVARRQPDIGFIYAGPVDIEHLSPAQRQAWHRLAALSNVCALGRVPPEDLPALYWRCQVGIIPYRSDMPMIVENGFPLKAIEMAAAGLPVVSTLMKPLLEVPEAVTVTGSAEAFCANVATNSRRTRSAEARAAADRICRAHDYDLLFDRMVAELPKRMPKAGSAPGDLAALADRLGTSAYTAMLARLAEVPSLPQVPTPVIGAALKDEPWVRLRVIGDLASFLSTRIPPPVRRAIPAPVRRLARHLIA